MITLSSAMKLAKNQLQGNRPFVWLVELWRDETDVTYYAREHEDVVFNGVTYVAKKMDIDPPTSDVQGTLHLFSVTVGNADRIEIARLMAGKYVGRKCVLRLVNLALLDSSVNQVTYRARVLSATADEKNVTFRCGMYDLRRTVVPRSVINALTCRWRWKSDECGYAGSITTPCDNRWESCRDIFQNEARFGGAPGMPRFRP